MEACNSNVALVVEVRGGVLHEDVVSEHDDTASSVAIEVVQESIAREVAEVCTRAGRADLQSFGEDALLNVTTKSKAIVVRLSWLVGVGGLSSDEGDVAGLRAASIGETVEGLVAKVEAIELDAPRGGTRRREEEVDRDCRWRSGCGVYPHLALAGASVARAENVRVRVPPLGVCGDCLIEMYKSVCVLGKECSRAVLHEVVGPSVAVLILQVGYLSKQGRVVKVDLKRLVPWALRLAACRLGLPPLRVGAWEASFRCSWVG